MREVTLKINLKSLALAMAVLPIGFMAFKTTDLKAQTQGATLSGTYACLSNSNMSGYVKQKTIDTAPSGINQLYTIIISANGTTASIGGLVENKVNNFEQNNSSTTTNAIASPTVNLTITANYPSPYIYKMVDTTKTENNTYYGAVTNGGNTLLFMGAPTSTSTMNGVCQKV